MKQVCKDCNGTGHDKQSRPEVKLSKYTDEQGRERIKHETLAQGSGCLTCLGLGVVT